MFKFLAVFVLLSMLIVPVGAKAEDTAESKYKIIIQTVSPEEAQQKNLPAGDSKYTVSPGSDIEDKKMPAPATSAVQHAPSVYAGPLVSMTAYNRRLGDVLLEIGSNVGYTVIFGPQVDPNLTVVVDLKSMPLPRAVRAITSFVNYSYEINNAEKTITILKTITKTFIIPDIAIGVPMMSAEMGGDMVGGGSGGSSPGGGGMFPGAGGGDMGAQNLKANVTLKKTDDKIDGRKLFEDNIKKLLSADGHYIIDWLSATLMVMDAVPNINLIEKYINGIKESAGKQLVVYATITQVSTAKEFRYGIDWNVLAKRLGGEILTDASRGREMRLETIVTAIPAPTLTVTRTAADVTAVLKALEEQGNVNVLANPYLYVRNLQPVAIFSGKSVPYIGSIQRSVAGAGGESTTSFSIARAQDGIMLSVRCHVKDDGNIDIQIAPILTSIDEFVTFNIEGNTFTNPVSSVQQTMQSVTVRDGETVVIGGVKREKKEVSEKAVPLLSKIPLLGAIFKSEGNTGSNSELVIALKVKKVQ
jgi:hypothetical protein